MRLSIFLVGQKICIILIVNYIIFENDFILFKLKIKSKITITKKNKPRFNKKKKIKKYGRGKR
ncbi:hypothetical protein MARBORIA2_18780 [Methanobrevibacter arboriphilus]|nr:hypothetical protein MARBORIA2_18780 [Methanobrevibacter arboriphilus]